MQWLKRIRVTVAIAVFLAISFLFLDFGNNIPPAFHNFFLATQFVPALLNTLVSFTGVSVGLICVTVLTFLFGRVYCSTFCPLGTLQDVVIRIARRSRRRRWFRFRRQNYAVHYALLFFTILFALFGSVVLLNLLEPFSNYGRILSNLISPVVVVLNNVLGYILGYFGSLFLFQIPLLNIGIVSIIAALCFFLLVIYLSYYHGRLFCNLLCPVGALLGLISRFSLFKIVIDENNCEECGLCERVCKANCIKSKSKEIDFAACIGCFNCLDACPTVGMNYKGRWQKPAYPSMKVSKGRRTVLSAVILPAIGMLLPEVGKDSTSEINQIKYEESRRHPISPPGSIGVNHFSNLCTACHLCISSCPTQVLFPSFLDYGITGVFQPKMNYDASYCNYDCVICSQVCPTGAILPVDTETKKQIQIGKVFFVKDDCIVVTKKKDCAACSEHCPTKAVKMVPYEKKLMIPEVKEEICVGCGACEHACPVQPRKAIYVNSNFVHQKAKKPEVKKIESTFDVHEDFPF